MDLWARVLQFVLCLGGTTLCGIVAIFFRVFVGRQSWLAMSLAVGVGVPLMDLTSLSYPPGIPALVRHCNTYPTGGQTNESTERHCCATCCCVLAGLATAILITTLVPEDNFQQVGIRDGAIWCVRPILEHSLLLRFTSGCRILLAATLGNTAILLVAMIVNNLDQEKGYPTRWL